MTLVADAAEQFDKRFTYLINGTAEIERLYANCRWAEGPVWFGDRNELLWSDIPNSRMLRWTWDGQVSVFRADSNYSNGNTRDREGRLVTCEHGGRRVTRTEADGSITVIADRYNGKRLNSPNDVVVKSDGSIWFTDPIYGIMSDYEGHKSEPEQTDLQRLPGRSGERKDHRGRRRFRAAERARLLAGRVGSLHRRFGREPRSEGAVAHPRVQSRRQGRAQERQGLRQDQRRDSRRLPRRHRGECVDQRRPRHQRLCAGGHAAGAHLHSRKTWPTSCSAGRSGTASS